MRKTDGKTWQGLVRALRYPYRSSVFAFVVMLILTKPAYFGEIPWLSSLFQAGLIVVSVYHILLAIINRKVLWMHVALGLYHAVLVVSTQLVGLPVMEALKPAVKALGVLSVFVLGMDQNPRGFLRGALPAYELWSYLNVLLLLLFPKGLFFRGTFNYYFLGHVNGFINVLFPGVMIALTYDLTYKKKLTLRSLLLIASVAANIILSKSKTGMACFAVFLIGLALVLALRNKKLVRVASFTTGNLVFLVIFVVIVANVSMRLSYFLIEDVLGEEIMLNERRTLWYISFANQPWTGFRSLFTTGTVENWRDFLLGHGIIGTEEYLQRFGKYVTSMHNLLLDIAYQGGVAAMACFAGYLVTVWRGARKSKGQLLYRVFAVAYITYAIMVNFEVFVTDSLLPVVMIFALWVSLPQARGPQGDASEPASAQIAA